MNTLHHQLRVVTSRSGSPAQPRARKHLLTLLVCSTFLAAGPAGLSAVAHVSQVSLQILVQVCRMSLAALAIFGS